jgi:N-acyl-D-aspartate/D-glutamate deacylase
MADNLRRRGGAASLLITEGPHKGRRLSEVPGQADPLTAAIAVIRVADPAVASFNQTESDIAAFMARPWVMTGSDASTGHPRAFGSFARKYAEYVVRRRVVSLRDFIERSTRLTADTFGLADRGRLRRGAFADIVVFDPRTYQAHATYEQPSLLASGVRAVLVNGVPAVENGKLTGEAAGRALAKTPPEGACI